ncbi:hypothetical protein BC938DRAFT_476126 [Jimgerdemannia flammicorona]|uniref:Uncharacterized protein n=1 Tax=Jimgerdemannia flammicorona TaxID=994334 RepID=A0A433QQZ0_9FUNG|nr:hypothetical protein BC938DRAFT_476126 [Jimgerdemannia flammicorona]
MILTRGDVQVHDRVQLVIADIENIAGNEEVGERERGQADSQQEGQEHELAEAPLVGPARDLSVVDGNDQGGSIVQDTNENQQDGRHPPVFGHGDDEEENEEVDGRGDTVKSVGAEALEDGAGGANAVDDRGQTGGEQDDIGSGASSISAAVDSNTDVSLLKSGGIVDTVTSHTNKQTLVLEKLDDAVLVFGNDLGETISADTVLGDLLLGLVGVDEVVGIEDDTAHTETTGNFLGNDELITGNHLDVDTEGITFADGLTRIGTRGVEKRDHTDKLVLFLVTGDSASDTEGTETTASESVDSANGIIVTTD